MISECFGDLAHMADVAPPPTTIILSRGLISSFTVISLIRPTIVLLLVV